MSNLCTLKLSRHLPALWQSHLMMLYYPLMGQNACLLYTLLVCLAELRPSISFAQLEDFSLMNQAQIEHARILLEQYLLIRTYADEEEQIACMEIEAPLDPEAFFSSAMFSRIFFNAMGREGMERVRALFETAAVSGNLKEISAVLQPEQLEAAWDERKEQQLREFVPTQEQIEQFDFDWTVFFRGCERSIPARLRTPDNLNRIAHLASVFGIEPLAMRVLVIRSIRDDKTRIDFDGLVDGLLKGKKAPAKIQPASSKKSQPADPDNYEQPPVTFLMARQSDNSTVLPEERRLILSLSEKHHFTNEVINTILACTMEQCGGTLPARYVRTLANNMARAKVTTRKEALDYLERPKKKKQTAKAPDLPDWYDEIPTEKATEEDLQAVLRLQQELFGGDQNGTN